MSRGWQKAITGMAVLVAVLAIGGLRALQSEPSEFQLVITKAPAAIAGPSWLCDSPECALLPAAIVLVPPHVVCRSIPAAALLAPICSEDFPHYIRPPPTI